MNSKVSVAEFSIEFPYSFFERFCQSGRARQIVSNDFLSVSDMLRSDMTDPSPTV